ncbi:MAG: hypothetical protein GX052_07195 [Syntrophomonadaceae bacterium]|jgi:hypothetical protein|nr:hypothetical protein [Syntrophomonadaceae bacterium]
MESVLILASRVVNFLHDSILLVVQQSGTPIGDKELHFWVFGLIGMIIFFCSHAAFKYLQRWGLGAVSFVFTGIILTILAVGIEVEQYITSRGQMDTADVVAGLAGFLAFFLAYCLLVLIGRLFLAIGRMIGGRKKDRMWRS